MIERFEATQYVTGKLTNELVVASLGNANCAGKKQRCRYWHLADIERQSIDVRFFSVIENQADIDCVRFVGSKTAPANL